MASRVPLVWPVLVSLLLSGCDSAEDLVNRRLPPVFAEQHHAAAIQAAQAAMAELGDANAGFNLRMEDIAATLNASGLAERLGIGQLRMRGDRQIIVAVAEVSRKFSKDDVPELDEGTKSVIEVLKPQIKGKITFGLGLTSESSVSEDGRLAIGLRLLPLFRNMEVDSLVLAGKLDVDVLVTLMNRLAHRISDELGRVEFASASFPAIPFKPGNLSLESADGTDDRITVSAKPVSSPVSLRSLAWLIDGDNATFAAELAPAGTPAVVSSPALGRDDYAGLQAEFAKKLMENLGIADAGSANWIAVSKRLVAERGNAAFAQGQPCIGVKVSLADRAFSARVTIPENATIDCTPKIDCTPVLDCGTANVCVQTEDCRQTRDCQVCTLGACFNDPACQREKNLATYNCEVRAALRQIECERLGAPAKAACERERAAQRASCEAEKSATMLACEAGKQSLRKRAGIANLAGTVGGSADLSVCLKEVAVASSLDRLAATATVDGKGVAKLGIAYVPLDIANHYACEFPWTEDKRIEILLPPRPARLDAALILEPAMSNLTLRADIKTSALAAHMRPSPRELVLGNYEMRAACAPTGAMLNEMTLDVTQSVPEIQVDFSLPGESRTLVLTLERASLHVSGVDVVAEAAHAWNEKAIILDADKSAIPAN